MGCVGESDGQIHGGRMTPQTRAAIDAAAESYGVSAHLILGPSRKRDHVYARWIAVRLLRDRGLSTPQIGREMGGLDHSTIWNALRRTMELDATWWAAFTKARTFFGGRTELIRGVIVYQRPAGPPREPRRAIAGLLNRPKTPDDQWDVLLGRESYVSVRIKPSLVSYTPAMPDDAREVA